MCNWKPLDEWTTEELEAALEKYERWTLEDGEIYGDQIDEVSAILKERAQAGTYAGTYAVTG